ncbi:MAG: glycosyl transferase [Pseudomonadales bacterium]
MTLIYFSPVKWNSFAQRPHKFVDWHHKRYDGEVVWVDPYPTRLPKLNDLLRMSSRKRASGVQQHSPPWLRVLKPKSLPVEPLYGIRAINLLLWRKLIPQLLTYTEKEPCVVVVAKPSILALTFLKQNNSALVVYDAMDDFHYFYRGLSKLSMRKRDLDLVARAHLILASSSVIYDKYSRLRERVEYVPNAFDSRMIKSDGQFGIATEKAVIGYIGTIGQWFDWSLVINLAKGNPNVYVKIVGPVFKSPPVGLPKNVMVLPSVNHQEAIEIMRSFSVGLIPFIPNDLTASVDPIKYYEYRALGLPILTTAFGEMADRISEEGVFQLDDMSNMRASVEAAIKFKIPAASLAVFRKENNWEARFSAIEVFGGQGTPSHAS